MGEGVFVRHCECVTAFFGFWLPRFALFSELITGFIAHMSHVAFDPIQALAFRGEGAAHPVNPCCLLDGVSGALRRS